jgi:hypothetical protein
MLTLPATTSARPCGMQGGPVLIPFNPQMLSIYIVYLFIHIQNRYHYLL